MGFLEWVDATKLVIGVILTAFGAVSGIILWVNKRMKAVADNAIREAGAPHQQTVHRLGKLEAEVIDMGQDVGSVQAELKQLNRRVSGVERTMESVAKQSDIAEISSRVAGLTGAFHQHTDSIGRQIDGLMQAALNANKKN